MDERTRGERTVEDRTRGERTVEDRTVDRTVDRERYRAGATRRSRAWIAWTVGSALALALGVAWTSAFLGVAVATRLDTDRAETNPVQEVGRVTRRDPSDGDLCVRYRAGAGSLTRCLTVDDSSRYRPGSPVRIQFDRDAPRHLIVVGNLDQPLVYVFVGLVLGGIPLVTIGLLGLGHALDLRAGEDHRFRSWWLAGTGFAGATTWLSFLYLARRAQRPRWLAWSAVYLLGFVSSMVLVPFGMTSRPGSNLGLVVFVVVWVGGMVHAMVIRSGADRAIVVASEHHPVTRRPPPPQPAEDRRFPPPVGPWRSEPG